jgi:hypothetical protein
MLLHDTQTEIAKGKAGGAVTSSDLGKAAMPAPIILALVP